MKIFELNMQSNLAPGKHKNLTVQGYDAVWSFIQANCSDYLQVVEQTKRFLFRGVKKKPDIFTGFPHATRTPVDVKDSSPKMAQEIISKADLCDLFLKAAGFTALRGNSIFCINNVSDANDWGPVYAIFPLNGFSFAYGTQGMNGAAINYSFPPSDITTLLLKEQAKWFIDVNGFKQTNLNQALLDDQNVWIHGKYIAVSWEKFSSNLQSLYTNLDIESRSEKYQKNRIKINIDLDQQISRLTRQLTVADQSNDNNLYSELLEKIKELKWRRFNGY